MAEGLWYLPSAARGVQTIAPDGRYEIILHRATPPIERRAGGASARQPRAFL